MFQRGSNSVDIESPGLDLQIVESSTNVRVLLRTWRVWKYERHFYRHLPEKFSSLHKPHWERHRFQLHDHRLIGPLHFSSELLPPPVKSRWHLLQHWSKERPSLCYPAQCLLQFRLEQSWKTKPLINLPESWFVAQATDRESVNLNEFN